MTFRRELFAVLTALSFALPSAAATLQVPADYATVQAALGAATSGDIVEVACGTWTESGLSIPSGVELRSATGDPACVTLDASGLSSVLSCDGVTGVRISGLTLTHGSTSQFGGGLFAANSEVELTGCRIVNNLASLGGGIYSSQSTLTVANCDISDNTANEESGVMCSGGTSSFTDCTIARNGTSIGGGMGLFSNAATLTRVHIVDNTSWETGGGIEVWTGSSATFVDCLIEGNSAAWGAGVYVRGGAGTVEITGTTIRSNTASDQGGGLLAGSAVSFVIMDSSILLNEAPHGADGFVSATGDVLVSCSDIDLARWEVDGALTVDDSGCSVPVPTVSWSRVKSRFRGGLYGGRN